MRYFAVMILFITTLLGADATIEIVKKIEKTPKIVVADSTEGVVDETIKRKFLKLLIGDLKVSGHFDVKGDYIKLPFNSKDVLGSGSELLLKCNLSQEPSGRLSARVKLLNAKTGAKLSEKSYAISKKERFPFLAHNIAIDINDYFNAPSIAWMNKYIVFAKYTSPGKSSIIVSDYTLSFTKTIVSGGLNIFPKWANSSQDSFYYTSYNSGKPTLYLLNLYSGTKEKILSSNGMIVCSDVSQDGNRLLITMAPNDQPDIYLYNRNSGSKKRLTKYRGIDVSGSFVDDESGVVFISERLGYPNIFYTSVNGGKAEQMVFHGKNNSSCTTYGNYIVYSSRESMNSAGRGVFNLYLISTKTDFLRKLTNGGKNMFPRFADDGETILFIKDSGGVSSLGILRLNANRSFLFPLRIGKIQSIDW
jgi:TolB protein